MTRLLTTAALALLMLLSIALPWADFSQEDYDDGLTSSQLDALREIGHTSGSKSIEPSWSWAEGAGGSSYSDIGNAIAVDSSGNAYVTGRFQASADFGNTTLNNSGSYDMFVAKLHSSGNWLWAKSAGGSKSDRGYGIAVDSSDNAYVTGYFEGTSADFGNTMLNSSGGYDVFVAKLDSSGNWKWAVRAGGSTHQDIGYAIAVDSSGNAYVTGRFQTSSADFGNTMLNSSGEYDVFVAKLNSSGNWQWAKSAGGSSDDMGYGIAVDSSGNAYVTGIYASSADFDSTTLGSSGGNDVFVAKIDAEGNWRWAVSAGGSSYDVGYGIAVDSDGNAYVTGIYGSSADFGSTTLNSSGGNDVFVAKLDSFGNWKWAVRAGGSTYQDIGYGIAVDSSDNAYVTGIYASSADFGSTMLSSSGGGDVFVAKLDSSGNWKWAKSAGGSQSDMGYGIAVDSSDNAYVTGIYASSADFGNTTLSSSGEYGVFVAKLSAGGEAPSSTNGRAGYEVELVGTMEPRPSTTDISGVVTNTVDVGDEINFLLVVLNSGTLDITELYVSVDVSPTGTTIPVAGTGGTPDGAVCDDSSNHSSGNPVCASTSFAAGDYLAYGSYAVRNSIGDPLVWTPSVVGEYTVTISLDPGDQDTDLTNNDLVFKVIVRDWYDISLDLTWDMGDDDDTGENTGIGPHDFTLSAVVDGSAEWQPRNVDLEITFGGTFEMSDSSFENVLASDQCAAGASTCSYIARMGTPTSVDVYHNLSSQAEPPPTPTMADRDVPAFATAQTWSGRIEANAWGCAGACGMYVSAIILNYLSYELVSTDFGGPGGGHENESVVNEMMEVNNSLDDRNGNNKDLLVAYFGVFHDIGVTEVTVGSGHSQGGRLDAGNSVLYATIRLFTPHDQNTEYDWEVTFDIRNLGDGQVTNMSAPDCLLEDPPQHHVNLGRLGGQAGAREELTVCTPLILDPGMYSITARVTLIDASLTNTDEFGNLTPDDDCGTGTNPDCHVDMISVNNEHTGYYEVVNNGPFVTLTMEVADGPIMEGTSMDFTARAIHTGQPDSNWDGTPDDLIYDWSVNTAEVDLQFLTCAAVCPNITVNNFWQGTPTVKVTVTDHWGATSTDSVTIKVWNSFSTSHDGDVDVEYDIIYYGSLPQTVDFSDAYPVDADLTGTGSSFTSVAAFTTDVSAILSPGDVYSEDMDVSFTGDSATQYSLWYDGTTGWVSMPSTQSQVDQDTMMLSWSNDGNQPSRSSSTYAVFSGANIVEPPQTGITDLGHTLAPGGVISISWSVSDASSIGDDDFGVIIIDGMRNTFPLVTTTWDIYGTHGSTYDYTVQVENGQSDQSGNRIVGSPVASGSATADGQVDPAAGASDLVAAEEAGNTVAFTWNVVDDSDVDHWIVCWSIGDHEANEVQGLMEGENSCSASGDKTSSHVSWRPSAAGTYHYSVSAVDSVGNMETAASSTALQFAEDQNIDWTSSPGGVKPTNGDGTDTDGDGYDDESDDCPSVAGTSTEYGRFGCPDTDGDGWADVDDDCKTIPGNSTVEPQKGCTDSDGDGWANSMDAFPADHREWMDSDSDGVGDGRDLCPKTTELPVDDDGCTVDDSLSNVLVIGAGVGGAALGSGLLFIGIPRLFGRRAKAEEMTGRKMEDELWGEPTPRGPPTAEEMAIDEPANSLVGAVRDDGFEYIEWPPDSEDWWYRQHSGTGWDRWHN